MKILFHGDTLNYRGTTVALTDYAKYNEEVLGNESIITYCKTHGTEKDSGSESSVVEALSKKYRVVGYEKGELETVIDQNKIDVAYFIRAGQRDFLPTNTKTAIHAVFQFQEPHGDRYAYVSKWLSETMSGGTIPYVPHIVNLPQPTSNYRQALNITQDKIVIGRIGGYYTFDVLWVKDLIKGLVERYDNIVFLFTGTEPFIDHPNVRFINEIHDLQKKSNFINTCDAMLHARLRGESFGLSIAEFLFHNKPVFSWNNGYDKNHLEMLKNSGLLYNSPQELEDLLLDAKSHSGEWSKRVQEYSPNTVMQRFKEVFLQ